ncbi:keratin, type I cytoskeletal 19-like [Polyodon spathula]|uniref:keratin, type I cytoskeletal 19-like n=1 Tax=Polyodon spathula TaxID=7913 RepID=UPI001B7ED6DD|nr:keratin, type I cytoskeletal 19-like [Polyodon spathula]
MASVALATSGYSSWSSSSQNVSSRTQASSTRINSIKSSRLSMARKAPSMYGGAGGLATRISLSPISQISSAGSMGGYYQNRFTEGFVQVSGKQTMQNLNDRLATYLEKVHSLESANSHLELQIREFYNNRAPMADKDLTGYYLTISELRKQISDSSMHSTKLMLQIDNAKLAADDFRIKYENELEMRRSVEGDIVGLRKFLDDLTLKKTDLEMEIERLKEDIIHLKKSHQEDVQALRSQLSSDVFVEVDSAPGVDLGKILSEIREQYESVVAKNLREVETWFKTQTEALSHQLTTKTTAIQTSKTKISELNRTFHSLEIELQAVQSLYYNLETTVAETERRYGAELSQLQVIIDRLQSELMQVRMDTERQGNDYRMLLDIKTRLEMEITEYRRLLDGESSMVTKTQKVTQVDSSSSIKTSKVTEEVCVSTVSKEVVVDPLVTRRVKIITQEVVDGVVMSEKLEEMEQQL